MTAMFVKTTLSDQEQIRIEALRAAVCIVEGRPGVHSSRLTEVTVENAKVFETYIREGR